MLAAAGRDLRPAPWAPAPAASQALPLLRRQRDDLVALPTGTRHRQHALRRLPAVPEAARAPLDAVLAVPREPLAALDAAIRAQARAAAGGAADLARLQTIVGVGRLTAAVVVAEARPRRAGASPAQVVADAGLAPAPHAAGTAGRGAGRGSTAGNARLRQAAYLAAVGGVRDNPVLRAFYQRLLARGQPTEVALVAAARNPVVLLVTVRQHGRTFAPDWAATHPRRRP
ncbi:MAG TPA: transposase [Thermomicrobiales bacterium]|nr:transposase [Thermomicrobiales bacterium]